MTSWAQPAPIPEPAPEPDQPTTTDDGTKPTPTGQTRTTHRVCVQPLGESLFDKAWLADETDVERYLESMRQALLDEIRKGKRIQI
jgi:hypothetical protein